MANKDFPLSLTIKAHDKASGPLGALSKKISSVTSPVKSLGSALGKVGGEAFALGTKLAGLGALAGFGLFKVVKGAVDAGDKLSEMSQRVGLSADAYAQLSFAAGQADIDQESFNGAMDQFNKRLGEAKAGGGPLLAFLKKVSPALAKDTLAAKDTEQAFDVMTLGFAKIKDPAKRAALAAAVFGKSGLQMGQFLGQGIVKINDMRGKFFELAGSQQEFADNASDVDNAMKENEVALLGLRNAAAGALFPALTELSKALSGVLAGNRGQLKEWAKETGEAISKWVQGGGLERLASGLRDGARAIGTLVDALGGAKGVMMLTGLYMAGPLLSSVVNLGSVIGQVGGVALPALARGFNLLKLMSVGTMFAPLMAGGPILLGIVALAGAGLLIYKNWGPIKQLFGDILDDLRGISKERTALEGRVDESVGDPNAKPTITKTLTPHGARSLGVRPPGSRDTTARVVVDINGAPKGTRVVADPKNTAPVDLSVGHSMVTP